jgi:acetyl-CoA acetyltransferase
MSLSGVASIVGVGETAYSRASGRSEQSLAVEAVSRALQDAGIPAQEVDGLVPYANGVPVEDVLGNLPISRLQFAASVQMGGASMVASLRLAAVALAAGVASTIVVYIAYNGSSARRVGRRVGMLPGQQFRTQFEHPYGWSIPAQWYAMICRRHMDTFGTTKRQLAEVALTMRRHAQLNERAQLHGRELSLEDYFNAELIADPYQKYDCCLETDGGAAVVLTTPERAARLARPAATLAGIAEARPPSPDDITNRPDWFDIGLTAAAPAAFEMAGVGPADMDAAMIYDCFTFEVIQQLEEAGFCQRGEGGRLVESGAIQLGGRLPVNPHGGLLAEGHLAGLNHVIEAIRQLRNEAGARQVKDARWIAVTGWGDMGDGAMAVLKKEAA